MNVVYTPSDWCFKIEDGRIFASKTASFITEEEALAWAEARGINRIPDGPYDEQGESSAEGLRQELVRFGLPLGELLGLEEVKAAKIAQIDAETSSAIIAGFDYEVDGTAYHFSYDAFDQQNFVDTASMCQLALSGTPGLPDTVTWNSYTVPEGKLVQQTFDAASFLTLYTAGAMAHKAARMAEGGERKAKVEAALTVEDVEAA